MIAGVIIPAAGQGTRMGGREPKQFLDLDGMPILIRTVDAFLTIDEIHNLVVAAAADCLEKTISLCTRFFPTEMGRRLHVTVGGESRQDSVCSGLAALPPEVNVVLVHDGARPLVSGKLILACLHRAAHGAVLATVAVKDTLKEVVEEKVVGTVDRTRLHAAQTPQGAPRNLFDQAFAKAREDGFLGTDEASLFEHAGIPVSVVAGDENNIKITRPGDLALAAAILKQKRSLDRQKNRTLATGNTRSCQDMKIGHGFDAHRLVAGRRLVLGGVEIPAEYGLLGHSDADVLTHALMDALLGALGMGDIGSHFPDSDPELAGISSLVLLERVMERVGGQGYGIGNCDLTIICQQPRLAPFIADMRNRLAQVCQTAVGNINIKATTTERMGAYGRGEGIAAHAVVLLSFGR